MNRRLRERVNRPRNWRAWATALMIVGAMSVAGAGNARAAATAAPSEAPAPATPSRVATVTASAASADPKSGTPTSIAAPAIGDASATASTTAVIAPPEPKVTLEQQTAWVTSGAEFSARLRLPAGHGGGRLDMSLYGAVDDASQVATTAKGEDLHGNRRRLPGIDVAAADATVTARIAIGSDRSRGAIDLPPGVYPLVLELSAEALSQPVRLVTHVVVMSATRPMTPRTVGVIARLDQPFRWSADGRLEVIGDPDLLFRNTAPLRDHPELPLTLMPTPGTLAALAGMPTGSRSATAIVSLAQRGQVMNASFSPLPTGAWASARLDQALVEQFADGEATLTSTIGAAPTGNTWVVSPADNVSVLRWLADRGVQIFIVPDNLTPGPPDTPFRINEVDGRHVAIRLAGTRSSIGTDGVRQAPTVADAHQLLAQLAVPALAHPDVAAPPTAILLDDMSNDAQPYLKAVVEGLTQPGPLAPTSAAGVLAQLAPGSTQLASWSLPSPKAVDLGGLGGDLESLHAASASFQASVGRDDPTAAAIHRAVLALPGVSAQERADFVTAVQSLVRRELATIEVARDQPITVTAHHADLPITLHNRGPRNLLVSFEVSSSDLEIRGPLVRSLQMDAGATVDVVVPVGVNRSGDFRLQVRVATADGQIPLADGALTVRSTAISGVGVVLSLGALVFLAVWWGRHIRRTRRARRDVVQSLPSQAEPSRVDEPVR